MTIKRYLFFILIIPFFANSQSITQISITDSIYCNGDAECVDIDLISFSNDDQYDLWIWRDIGLVNNQLIGIVEDVINTALYEPITSSSGTLNYCFENTGNYVLEITNESFDVVTDTIWTTMPWPVELGVNQMNSNNVLECNGNSDGTLKVNSIGGVPPLNFSWSGPNGFTATQTDVFISEISGLSAGNYFLFLTDNNGCENNSFVANVSEPSNISVDITIDNLESCYDSSDAQLTVTASGGNNSNYSYLWDNGETTPTILAGAGFHSVVIEDADGCQGNSFIELDEIPALSIDDIIIDDALCVNTEGFVELVVSGGTGDLSYDWPAGTSNTNTQNLSAGEYEINITDENSCLVQATFNVLEADSIEFSLNSIVNTNCFGTSDGEISFAISGGTPNYSITFNGENSLPLQYLNINSDTSFQNFEADNYSIFITDDNGCTNSQYLDSVSLFEPSELSITDTTITNVLCFGNSTGNIEVTVSGGHGNYIYNWTDELNNSIGNESFISDLSAGTYSLLVNDSVCSESFSFEITQFDQIQYQSLPNPNDVSCFGGNDGFISDLVIQGGLAPYQYSWDNNGVIITQANPSSLEAGLYELTVIDSNECQLSFPVVEISEPSELIFLPNSVISQPSCFNVNDGSMNIFANGGVTNYTYQLEEITSGSLYFDNELENLPAGEYNFKVTDSNGCEIDSLFTFNNPDDLVFSSTTSDLTCFESNDGFIAYSFEEGFIPPYTIYFEGAIQANDTVFGLAASSYTSFLEDGNGCTKTLINTISQPDIISYTSDVVIPSCNENNLLQNGLISNGKIILDLFGGSGFYEVIVNEDTNQVETGISLSINNLSADSYDIDVVDNQGCLLSFSETVQSPNPINVYADITDVIVFGNSTGSIDISVTGGQQPYDISWTGPGFISNSQDIINLQAGIYTLVVVDANGCYELFEYAVNQGDCNVQINPSVVEPSCSGDNAIINFDLYGGIPPYSCYLQGDIDSDGNIDEVLPNTNITSSLASDLVVPAGNEYTLFVEDASGCLLTYNFVIPVVEPISLSANIVNASCYGSENGKIIIDPITDVTGGTAPYDINWLGLDLNPVDPYALSSGQYIVTIEDDNGCQDTSYFNISEPTQITLFDAIVSHTNCTEGTNTSASDGSISVIAQGGNTLGSGLYQYSWSDVSIPSLQNIDGLSPGSYSVTISDQTNCSSPVYSFEILSPEFIEFDYYTTDPISCHNNCDGSISVFTSNTSTDLFYWYDVSDSIYIGNSNTLNNLCEGSYYFAIENEFNCYRESPALGIGNITLDNPDEFTINLTHSVSVPNGLCDGLASVTSTSGVGLVTFDWSTGETTSTIENLCGNEIYQVIATDENNCESFEQFIVEEDDCNLSIGDLTVENISCNNANDGKIYSQNTFQGGYPPYTIYLYNQDILVDQQTTNSNLLNFSSLSEGEYFVILEDVGGCLSTFSTPITNPNPISYSYEIENSDCYNSFDPEVHITITGGTPFSGTTAYDIDFFDYEYYLSYEENGIENYVSGNNVSSGNYPLIVSDSNECITPIIPSNDIFIVEVNEVDSIFVDVQVTSPSCNGDSDGIAILTFNGGQGPFDINWYENGSILPIAQSNIIVEGLSAGNYYVSVKDTLGCETIHYFDIIDINPITVVSQITSPSCVGSSDGSISTIISGGNGGYDYLWSPGSMISNNVTGLSAGIYDLIITDVSSCVHTETFVVNDPDVIAIDLSVSTISCNGLSDGSISATASLGSGIYTYQWYLNGGAISSLDGGISPDIVNLSSGIYSVEVMDTYGCTSSMSYVMMEPSSISIEIEQNDPSCFGFNDGQFIASVNGGADGFQFVLKDESNNILTEEFYSNQLLSGTYNLVVTDINSCQDSVLFTLNDPDAILLNVNVTDVSCYDGNNGSATFDVQNNIGPVNNTWSKVIALNDYEPISFSEILNNNVVEGNYILEVIDSIGCIQSEFFSVEQADSIEVTILTSPSVCSNVSGATAMASILNASEPINYVWTINQENNITQTTETATGLSPGTIYLNGTDDNGCAIPLTVVEIPESENALIQVQIDILNPNNCFNDSQAELEAVVYNDDNTPINSNVLYQWYFNGNAVLASQGGTVNILSDLGPGVYSVEVINENLGCIHSYTIELFNPSEITIDIVTEDIDCFGDSVGTALATVVNGTLPLNYQWNNSMGVNIESDVFNPLNLKAGIYELVVTDFNGCNQSEVFEIFENDSLALEINAQSISCFGGDDGIIYSSIVGGFGDYSYQWRNDLNEIISISPSATDLTAQNYTLTVSDDLDCSVTSSLTLDQAEEFIITTNIVDINCFGYSTGSISLDVSGGTGELTYEWDSTEDNVNQIINLGEGTYQVIISDENGCQTTESYYVEQSPQLVASAEGIFQSCTEGIVNITSVEGGTLPYEFFWLDDPTNETMSISNLMPGYHTFIISDFYDCMLTDSALISGSNEIFTSLSSDSVLCQGDSTGSITVSILNADNYPYYYSINDENSFDEMVITPTFVIDSLPVGDYTIYIKDGENCIDTTEQLSLFEPTSLEVQILSTDVLCFGNDDGLISIQSSGGIAPYDISLDAGNTFVTTDFDGMEELNVFSGDYEVLISDHNDCTVSESVSINQPEPLFLSVSNFSDYNGFNNSCYNSNDASLTINISGGTGDIELSFNDSSLMITNGFVLENLSKGDYSFAISDTNLCSETLDTVITAPDTLSFSLVSVSDYNGVNTSCFGINDASLLTSVSGGVGPYDYSNNGGTSFIVSNTFNEYNFENLGAGIVNFQVKDLNECVDTFSYEITSSEEIIPSLSLYTPISCNGLDEAVILAEVQGGIADYTFDLSNQENTQTIESTELSTLFTDLSSGFYELNVVDINGCTNTLSNASQLNVDQPDSLAYDINIGEISCNSVADGTMQISNINGGVGGYSFKLYNTSGFYHEEDNLENFDLLEFDSLASSAYILIITDENDCQILDTIAIDNPEILSVVESVTDLECYGVPNGNVQLNVQGGSSPYVLTLNNTNYTEDETFSIEGLIADNYNFQIIDDNGCQYISDLLISQPDSLIFESIIQNNICFGQSFGEVTFNVTGGVLPYTFQFTDVNGILISDSSTVSNLAADTYFISVSDSNGCAFDDQIEISEPKEIVISHVVFNETCTNANDGQIITSILDFQESFEVFWSDVNLSGIENTNLSPNDYIITVVDNKGCFKTDTVSIESALELNVFTAVTLTECEYTNNGALNVDFPQDGNYFVQLTDGTSSYQNSTTNELLFDNLSAGDYILTINYDSICTYDTTITITHEGGYGCIVPEPTFTPNYDGINDDFAPAQAFYENVELFIYNRWGTMLYNQKSVNPKWDGTDLNGNLVPSADYYYIIKFNNTLFNDLTGIITLLK